MERGMTTSPDKLLSIARESGAETGAWIDEPSVTWVQFYCLKDLAGFVERIRQDERERVLKAAKSRYDHEAKGAAHHAGRWHAAYEYHMTRQAAMSDMLDAIRSISTTESKGDANE
jgi:hypothetical protein